MRLSTHIFTLITGLLLTCNTAYSQTDVQVYTLAEIDSIRLHYDHSHYSMKYPENMDSIPHSPLYRFVFQGIREWSETADLSWEYFIPISADEIGSNSTISITAIDRPSYFKYRNTDYQFKNLTVYIKSGFCYYDPAKADDWDLRYNQVLFDMAELSAREAVRNYNNDTSKGHILDLYE